MGHKKNRSRPKDLRVRPEEAEELFQGFEIGLARAILLSNPDHVGALSSLGAALTAAGRHVEALEVDLRTTVLLKSEPTAFYNLACSYSNLKRVDESLATLKKAIDLGYRDFSHMLRDPDLEHVRRDPRFKALLHKKWGKRQP